MQTVKELPEEPIKKIRCKIMGFRRFL